MSKALLGAAGEARGFAELLSPVGEVVGKGPRKRLVRAHPGHDEGFAAGHSEGYAAGLQTGREQALGEAREATSIELQRIAAELDSIAAGLRKAMEQWYRDAEESLALLSIAVAERLIAQELARSDEAARSIVREAIGEVTHAGTARIRVNPFASGALEKYRDELLALAPSVKNLEIVSDSSLGHGCVIETEGGVIDAQIRAKIRRLFEAADQASQALPEAA